ncbi:MAG: ATP-grasp domain-containing protein [Candidatus Rokubacteria bacterium]|nr:ATP-grasp domain-containing protein [Candidatus Rokubacteria bacterium]
MSVLVTDASGNHALAVVRSLGRRGIRVAAADSAWWAKSFFSRYCARRALHPSPAGGVDAFVSGLCRILDEVRPMMLMPMTERTILALMVRREEIESRVALAPLPAPEALSVVFDKHATIELATSLGVPVPKTLRLSGLEDLDRLRSEISFPAVIKPRRSEIWTADDRIVPGGPVEYCFSAEELEAKYLAVHRRAPLPLIQEFIPGEGYGVSVLYRRGRLKALFAHRRLRMIRPTGSGSSLRESIAPPPAMVDAARALLDALAWHGVAMVEFKLDARDGTPKLMEVNGRFWNSVPLAVAAGVDFPFLLYRLAVDGDVREHLEYRVGVQSRWLVGDVRHLVEVLGGKPRGWADGFPSRWRTLRDFMKFFGRDMHYDEFWLSDPLPLFADFADFFFRQVPQRLVPRRPTAVEEKPACEFAPSRMGGPCGFSG